MPVAVLVSSHNPLAGGRPSLMTLDDAETLYHDFGHALQAMLTTVREPLAAGLRWVRGWVGGWVGVECRGRGACSAHQDGSAMTLPAVLACRQVLCAGGRAGGRFSPSS